MATKRKTNPFTNRKATVSVHRNGLSIEISDVSATDSGAVAKELLVESRLGLPDIAAALGYADEGSFIRAFRRWTGTTPGAWRESAR